ncbi:MAG: hypothetical protein JSV18_02275 [Candidatus Bathyarchaeota archaeon]|nr:MAG: hypothetical protein JSV18_02275 [Candidatus Bathyarchaeota archaeon]
MQVMEQVPPHNKEETRASDLRILLLRQENLEALERIQKIIMVEEDRFLSVEEVLSRILGFYNRFVPFKEV